MLSFLGFVFAVAPRPRAVDDARGLLERVARRDRAALRKLYDLLAGQSLAVALRVLSVRGEAEEVVQETFVEVWSRCEQFDPARGSARAWVLSIARNRAIDRLRNRGAVARMVERVTNDTLVEPGRIQSPLEAVEQREARDRVQAAMLALTAEQRLAIELAYYEGLSQSEIAARVGEPLGTVKSRVRAAMERMAAALHGGEP